MNAVKPVFVLSTLLGFVVAALHPLFVPTLQHPAAGMVWGGEDVPEPPNVMCEFLDDPIQKCFLNLGETPGTCSNQACTGGSPANPEDYSCPIGQARKYVTTELRNRVTTGEGYFFIPIFEEDPEDPEDPEIIDWVTKKNPGGSDKKRTVSAACFRVETCITGAGNCVPVSSMYRCTYSNVADTDPEDDHQPHPDFPCPPDPE